MNNIDPGYEICKRKTGHIGLQLTNAGFNIFLWFLIAFVFVILPWKHTFAQPNIDLNLPRISVSAMEERVVDGNLVWFNFAAESLVEENLRISVTLSMNGRDFLENGIVKPFEILFDSGLPESRGFGSDSPILLESEIEGRVILTIQSGAGYVLGNNPSAETVLYRTSSPNNFSIFAVKKSVTEGSGEKAHFRVRLEKSFSEPVTVHYFYYDGIANFLKVNYLDSANVVIPANKKSADIYFDIVNDNFDEIDGQIIVNISKITMDDQNISVLFNFQSRYARILVYDDDISVLNSQNLSEVSISPLSESATEGDTIRFKITANSTSDLDRKIGVSIKDYIPLEGGPPEFVVLPANKLSTILELKTVDRVRYGQNYYVIVTLLPDLYPGGYRFDSLFGKIDPKYKLASTGTRAQILLIKNDEPQIPTVSISSNAVGNSDDGVIEGKSFRFFLSTDYGSDFVSDLSVKLSISDGGANLGGYFDATDGRYIIKKGSSWIYFWKGNYESGC